MPPTRLHRPVRSALMALLPALLVACASAPPHNPQAQWRASPNFDARRAQLIVLHHTEQGGVEQSLHTLRTRNAGGRVSAHYLVARDGRTFQLVADGARAWHAGAAQWGVLTDLNSASIGIELDNDGASGYPDAQVDALLRLLDDLTARLRIPLHAIVAHGDIAPARKSDPNERFPWPRLAQAGYGLWPRASLAPAPAGFDPWVALALLGYDLRDPAAALRAFHRRYRGHDGDAWQSGDADVLHDLMRQRLAMPADAPAPIAR